MYLVTILFVAGALEGIETVAGSPVPFEVGHKYKSCVTSSEYIVLSCVKI